MQNTIETAAQTLRNRYRSNPGFHGVRTSGIITLEVTSKICYDTIRGDLSPSWTFQGFPVVIETLPLTEHKGSHILPCLPLVSKTPRTPTHRSK